MLSERCLEAPRQFTRLPSQKLIPDNPWDVTSLRFAKKRGTQRREETHLPVDLLNGRSTTSYTFRDTLEPHGNRRVFRKSTEKPRDSLAFLPRRLLSTFVPSAAFIDSKSVADSRSKISFEKPKRGVTSVTETVERLYATCKICQRRKLDWQIFWGCLVRC